MRADHLYLIHPYRIIVRCLPHGKRRNSDGQHSDVNSNAAIRNHYSSLLDAQAASLGARRDYTSRFYQATVIAKLR
jgi:hypothetical protein